MDDAFCVFAEDTGPPEPNQHTLSSTSAQAAKACAPAMLYSFCLVISSPRVSLPQATISAISTATVPATIAIAKP